MVYRDALPGSVTNLILAQSNKKYTGYKNLPALFSHFVRRELCTSQSFHWYLLLLPPLYSSHSVWLWHLNRPSSKGKNTLIGTSLILFVKSKCKKTLNENNACRTTWKGLCRNHKVTYWVSNSTIYCTKPPSLKQICWEERTSHADYKFTTQPQSLLTRTLTINENQWSEAQLINWCQ